MHTGCVESTGTHAALSLSLGRCTLRLAPGTCAVNQHAAEGRRCRRSPGTIQPAGRADRRAKRRPFGIDHARWRQRSCARWVSKGSTCSNASVAGDADGLTRRQPTLKSTSFFTLRLAVNTTIALVYDLSDVAWRSMYVLSKCHIESSFLKHCVH